MNRISNRSKKTKQLSSKSNHGKFRWKRLLKWVALPILTLFIAGFVFASLLFAAFAASAPKFDINKLQSQPNTTILDKNGKVVAELGAEQRTNVTADQIPMQLVNAVTSIEDHTFFSNRGIDPVRIAGSLISNASSGSLQGGSTISQELIKLSFFSTAESDRTIKRKAQEAWLSVEMNNKLSKEEILTLYINKVYMSNGYYGMQTASENFYQKPLSQLDLAQTALLAGMPQAPNTYNPYSNPDAAKWRRDLVLQAMYKYGTISKEDMDKAIATPIDEGLQSLPTTKSIPSYLDNYVTEVINQVKDKTGKDPTTVPMKIYTPLDSDAQQRLYDIYNTADYIAFPDDDMQVASTVVDVTNGNVVAQLGGRKQAEDVTLGFNQAVSTDRDWGSTMKPLTDYGPAFDFGYYKTTAQQLSDTPYNYPGTSTALFDFDNQYMGNMSARTALQLSRNIPAIKTLETVGLTNATTFLKKLNILYPQLEYSNGISSNTSESGNQWGASSEKMAAAYSAFANGGTYYSPTYVDKISFSDGSTKDFTADKTQAMNPDTAYMITDILKGVITGADNPNSALSTGLHAQVQGVTSAGKTGTSNYTDSEYAQVLASIGGGDGGSIAPDENFVGYTTKYAMAIWTGYSNRMIPIWGTKLSIAADVYKNMFSYLYQNQQNSDWTMPSDLFRSGADVYKSGTSIVQSSSSASSSSTSDSNTSSSSVSGPSVSDSSSASSSSH